MNGFQSTQIAGPQNEWRVLKREDGVYRWIGELNLYRDPTIFLMIVKIFFWIIVGMFVLLSLFDLGNPDFFWKGLLQNLKLFGIFLGGFLLLSLMGYLIYAKIMGGRYTVIFEMTEEGFTHTQIPPQAEKARKISGAAALTGILSGSISTIAVGINSSRTAMSTDFSRVRSIQGFPRRGVIKVNERLNKNQLFMLKDDYELVLNYLKEHCPNAKIK